MEQWARRYGSTVRFLTVCVDSVVQVAVQFGRMFDLQTVVNGHIPSRSYMPVGYGQLGCSGFVVSDEKGCFVSRKTQAFLQYGDHAFRFLEDLLRKKFGVQPGLEQQHQGISCPIAGDCGTDEEEKKQREEEAVLTQPVPSVGIQSMDAEHDSCERAFSLLQAAQTVEALEHVMGELTSHFRHEEQLMKAHGFGSQTKGSGFSPLASHVKDHERILSLGYDEMGRASIKGQTMACEEKNAEGIAIA